MSSVEDIVGGIMGRAGVPLSIWGPIMDIESKGDPNAALQNSNEDSIGLFALNRSGGLGSGYTVAQLKDPETNATIAAGVMGPNYKKGVARGLSGLELLRYVAYNSGFPTMQGVGALGTDQVVRNYDVKLVAEFNSGEGGGGSAPISSSLPSSVGTFVNGLGISKLSKGQKMGLVGVAVGVVFLVGSSE